MRNVLLSEKHVQNLMLYWELALDEQLPMGGYFMNRALRFFLIFVVLVALLLILASVGIVMAANTNLSKTYELYAVTVPDLPTDAEIIATEGERLYTTRLCIECHGADGSGTVFVDVPILARLGAANLTTGAGGIGSSYSLEDFVRLLQHGIKPDGRGAFIMPSESYGTMRAEEMATLLAYIQSLPPVDNNVQIREFGPLGYALVAFGAFPLQPDLIQHETVALSNVEVSASVEYGATLAPLCIGCHGKDYAGMPLPDDASVIAPNLTSHPDGMGGYSLEEFMSIIRTGQRPNGTILNPVQMPWEHLSAMTDVELEAIYLFLKSTPAIAGN